MEQEMKCTEESVSAIWGLYQAIQVKKPLVHCITNMVTVNDCANILLAAGASPTMACHPMEVSEVTSGCKSLVLNFGAIKDYEAMLLAGKSALKLGHPIIIDPVGAGGSTYRRNLLADYLEQVPVTCIRGNASEILALIMNQATVTGVDASADALKEAITDDCLHSGSDANADFRIESSSDASTDARNKFAVKVAAYSRKINSIVIVSGEKDLITDGYECYEISNGHPLMARITGAGCMSTALLGAYLGVQSEMEAKDDVMVKPVHRAVAACVVMGICGELAALKTQSVQGGTMTFHMHLIDAMSMLTKDCIRDRVKVRRLELQ